MQKRSAWEPEKPMDGSSNQRVTPCNKRNRTHNVNHRGTTVAI